MDKLTASLVVSAWRVLISVGSSVALLKLPRRPLFLSTTLLVSIAMFSLGLFFYLRSVETYQHYFDTTLTWAPLLLVILIFAGGQLGFSPIIKVQSGDVGLTQGLTSSFSTSTKCCGIFWHFSTHHHGGGADFLGLLVVTVVQINFLWRAPTS